KQLRPMLNQPLGPVIRAGFLVRGEQKDQVTIGLVAFTAQADEGFDRDGIVIFNVLRAAPVVVALFFDQAKGVGGPLRWLGFHYVQVRQDYHWRLLFWARLRGHR